MSKKIILFLSDYKEHASEQSYYCPQGEMVTGAQTWEAPVKYLLQTYPDVSAVLCVVTPAARSALPELKRMVAAQAPKVEIIAVPFDEQKEDFNTGPLSQIMASVEKGDEILLETTGGLRDAIMHLLLVSRVLSYTGIPTAGAVYSNFGSKRIVDCSQLIGLFDLVSGMQELTSFGRVDVLRSYYASRPHAKSIDRLLNATEELWDSIALCRAAEVDQKLEQFNKALAGAERCTDPLIQQLLPTFTQKFGQELDIPGLIRWCVQNGMLLQGIVIYAEQLPAYLLGTTELLKIPPYKKARVFPGSQSPAEYYNLMFQRQLMSLSRPGAIDHLRCAIETVKDIDHLIEKSWFAWRGPKELLRPVCLDYLYLKNVRNRISHTKDELRESDQEFANYLKEIHHLPLTVPVDELKQLVLEALDRIQEAVEYMQGGNT